jgi:hypothetical protein
VLIRVRREDAAEGGIRPPGSETGDFVAMKRLANFKIILGDGSVVGPSVLPDHLRMTYYNLCHDRKALFHRHLKQINPMLAAGMIAETATIAEGIRASSSTTSLKDLAVWKTILESFELMGTDVAFMRKRIDDLLGLLGDPSSRLGMEEPEGYKKMKLEQARLVKQARALEARVSIIKDALKEIDAEMNMVGPNAKKKQVVRQLASSPW